MKNKILLVAFLFLFIELHAQINEVPTLSPPPPPPPAIQTFSINDWGSPAYQFIRRHHAFPGCADITNKAEKWRCSFFKKETFVMGNLRYPDDAFKKSVEGVVILKFIIEKDGSMSNVRIEHGIGYGCDEEAIRVLGRMPHFEPGIARGRPLRETQYISIGFSKNNFQNQHPLRYKEGDWMGKLESETNKYISFLEKNLIYPEEAFYNAIQGIVLVKIQADEKGKQDFKIEYGIDLECDKEALRLVKLMSQYQSDIWGKELNKETQYVPILFSVYAYELWRNSR